MRKTIGGLTVAALALTAAPSEGKLRATRDARSIAGAFMKGTEIKSNAFDADFLALPPEGRPVALSNRKVAKFPRRGNRFAMLSTGNSLKSLGPNKSKRLSANNRGAPFRGARDVVMLRTKFKVPKGNNCLSFRFKFLSEEFPEFVDSPYNDAFIAELDHSNWDSPRKDPSIDYSPRNFAEDSMGNRISVNAVGDAAVKRKYARGTTYDAATRTLRASTPVTPGRHKLFLSIFDQGDRQYDSTVFVDGLRFNNRNNCRTGVVLDK